MKPLTLILTLLIAIFTSSYGQTVDRIGVKGPLVFNGSSFYLSGSDKPNKTYYVQEYQLENPATDPLNQRLSVHLYTRDLPIEDVVQLKVQELEKRKVQDTICEYEVAKSPDGQEYMLDFSLGEPKEGKPVTGDFFIYRYRKVTLKGGQKGVMIFAYARRYTGDAIAQSLRTFYDNERLDLLNKMSAAQMPTGLYAPSP